MNEIVKIMIAILSLFLGFLAFVIGWMIFRKYEFSSSWFSTITSLSLIFLSIIYISISISNMLYCKNPKYNCKWYDLENVLFWEKKYWQHLF